MSDGRWRWPLIGGFAVMSVWFSILAYVMTPATLPGAIGIGIVSGAIFAAAITTLGFAANAVTRSMRDGPR